MIANILAISLMIKVLSVENFGILSIALLIFACALIFELQTSQSLQIYIPGYIKNNRTLSISNVLLISYILRQVAYPFIALIVFMFSQKLAAFYGIDIEIIWIICFGLLIRALASPLDFGNLIAFNKRIELSNQNFIETFSIILIIYILYSYSIKLEYFLILWMIRLLPVFIYSWFIYWHSEYKIKDKVSFYRSLLIIKKITNISFASFLLTMIGKLSKTLDFQLKIDNFIGKMIEIKVIIFYLLENLRIMKNHVQDDLSREFRIIKNELQLNKLDVHWNTPMVIFFYSM
jgi:hypothetical protein